MWGWWELCKPGQLLRLLVYGSGWFLDQALTAREDRRQHAPLTQPKRKFRVLQILSFPMDLFGDRAVECCAVFCLLLQHAYRFLSQRGFPDGWMSRMEYLKNMFHSVFFKWRIQVRSAAGLEIGSGGFPGE